MSVSALGMSDMGLRVRSRWMLVGGVAVAFVGVILWLGGGSLREGVLVWYALAGTVNASLQGPLTGAVDRRALPSLAALLFGVLGATSPCQISTNAAALAYAVQGGTAPVRVGKAVTGYVLGKLLVYGVLGGGALLLGSQVGSTAIPLIQLIRLALGPLMLLMGLVLLQLLNPGVFIGHRFSAWLRGRVPQSPLPGGFLLGIAFGLAFCPTLFLLFFSLTIPLALASSYGLLLPFVFALGTTIPLLVLATLVAFAGQKRSNVLQGFMAVDRLVRPAAGLVLLLAGLNDTLIYWFL